MAKTIVRDASVTVNSVDLSDHVSHVEINQSYDDVDVTAMGAAAKQHLLGMGDDQIVVHFWQDFDEASVNATLGGLVGSNTPFPVVVQPGSGAVSATNPSYTMQSILGTYSPLSADVGAASETDCTFMCGDGQGITIDTGSTGG
jgi:hypothetical protein